MKKIILLLTSLTPIIAIFFQPIRAPILPVSIGKITVVNDYHSFIFSINLLNIAHQIDNLDTTVEKILTTHSLDDSKSNQSKTIVHISYRQQIELLTRQIAEIKRKIKN